jgi:hypothetical protein
VKRKSKEGRERERKGEEGILDRTGKWELEKKRIRAKW